MKFVYWHSTYILPVLNVFILNLRLIKKFVCLSLPYSLSVLYMYLKYDSRIEMN